MASGATLIIGPGVRVVVNNTVTIAVGATLNVRNGATLEGAEGVITSPVIVVNGTLNVNPELNATGASFRRSGTYGNSALQVGSGGRLTAHNSTFTWSSLVLASGSILNSRDDITGNAFDQSITIPPVHAALLANNRRFQDVQIVGNLSSGQSATLAPLGADTQLTQRYVFTSTVTIAVGATLTFSNGASLVAVEGVFNSPVIVVNGTLNATGASFTRSGTYGNSALQVASGGRLTATNSTFAWSSLVLTTGSILNSGDITGNAFDQPITIPPVAASLLANNRRFQDIHISGNLNSGQTATLAPLGADTRLTQRYLFSSTVTVQTGATLTVSSGASLVAVEGVFNSPVIMVNGTLNATGASFTRSGTYGNSALQVGSGGRLTARDCTFAWSSLVLATGSILNSGDITNNGFDQPITIPPVHAALVANNWRFQDVHIVGNLSSGQTAILAPLGTDTQLTQRYVFSSTVTVAVGATLNVSSGASLVGAEGVFNSPVIVVNGTLNATGASFTRSGTYGNSALQVASGGRLTARDCTFAWSSLNLLTGSTDTLNSLIFANHCQLAINSGATINITRNNFSAIGTNGIVATGNANATIDLRYNFWGTTVPSLIEDKIRDHRKDSSRPTVLYDPAQASSATMVSSSPNPSGFGQAVTFRATVSAVAPGSGTPTGTVTFQDGTTYLGDAALINGAATFTTSALGVGSHVITASYGGDSHFTSSISATLIQMVSSVMLGTTFAGLDSPASGQYPWPDTRLAAGPNHLVEVVNSQIAIYTKAGVRLSSQPLSAFFSSGSVAPVSPTVFYDDLANRFVVAALERNSILDLAVSNSSDPTQGFTEIQRINVQQTANGQTFIAFTTHTTWNADAYVVSMVMAPVGGPYTDHLQVMAIAKSSLLDANPNTLTRFQSVNRPFDFVGTAMHGSVAGDPIWVVTGWFFGGNTVRLTRMTNVLSNAPIFTDFDISVSSYDLPPNAPQRGSSGLLNLWGASVYSASLRGNRLVAAQHVGTGGVARVRWYEFNVSNSAAPTLAQSGEINPGAGVYTYFPSIEIAANGDLGLNYLQSSATEYLSMYVTGRTTADPLGTMRTPVLIQAGRAAFSYPGSSPYLVGFSGGISVDAASGTSFWAAHEFATNAPAPNWGTWIANFRLSGSGPGGVPPKPDPNETSDDETLASLVSLLAPRPRVLNSTDPRNDAADSGRTDRQSVPPEHLLAVEGRPAILQPELDLDRQGIDVLFARRSRQQPSDAWERSWPADALIDSEWTSLVGD